MDTRSYKPKDSDGHTSRSSARLVRAFEYGHPTRSPVVIPLSEKNAVILGRGTRGVVPALLARSKVIVQGEVALRVETNDEWMSTDHARISHRDGAWVATDLGSKNGTCINGGAVEEAVLPDGARIEVGHTIFVFRAADAGRETGDRSEHEIPALRTASVGFARQLDVLEQIAPSRITTLVHGESGTGKELVARTIHQLSARSGPFVAVNCGAIPATLLEAQLFGHKKGAFSGATQDSPGLIRAADGGTLFLDEIAELSEPSQVALLRVLQENEVLPVGETTPVPVDVRFVAATHQDLAERIGDGRFREDLYARLSGFILTLPPLRDRMEDLGGLVATILRDSAQDEAQDASFTRDAANALYAYTWPRNIRELKAAVSAALTIAPGNEIERSHLPDAVRSPRVPEEDDPLTPSDRQLHTAIVETLKTHNGNVSASAKAMGYSRSHFHRLLNRLDIAPERFRR